MASEISNPAEYLTLRITDGDETFDLVDNISFSLAEGGWSPSVAFRRISQLAGYGPYGPVEEQISLWVYGERPAETINNLQRLVNMMDQADAWSLGDRVNAVRLQVQIQGSELAEPLESVILGRVSDDAPLIVNPPTFNDTLTVYQIGPITLRFLRQGLWYGEEIEGDSNAQATPSIFTIDMREEDSALSPTRIELRGFSPGTAMMGGGLVALTGVSRFASYGVNLGVYAAANMTSTEFAAVDDSAHLAHGDDVMRINAAAHQTGALTVANIHADVARVSVFAAVRNNNAGTSWNIRAKSSGFVTTVDRWQKLEEGTDPQLVWVGTLSNQVGAHVNIGIEVETADSTGTLDINYLAIFPHDASAQHVAILPDNYTAAGYERNLVIDHRVLDSLTPNIWIETAS